MTQTCILHRNATNEAGEAIPTDRAMCFAEFRQRPILRLMWDDGANLPQSWVGMDNTALIPLPVLVGPIHLVV